MNAHQTTCVYRCVYRYATGLIATGVRDRYQCETNVLRQKVQRATVHCKYELGDNVAAAWRGKEAVKT